MTTVERFLGFEVTDIRFPTSRWLDGSDAMNPEPDYSAAYLTLRTSRGAVGYGFTFTVGRGNDVQAAAIRAFEPLVQGLEVEATLADLGGMARRLYEDAQLRWLGPMKGAIHMAVGAITNAMWDMRARRVGVPVWRLLSELPPAELVSLVDFRYLDDVLTREEALDILTAAEAGRAERTAAVLGDGIAAYTSSPGWLGYDDDKLVRLCREAASDGFRQVKLKVGGSIEEDVRRVALATKAVGPDVHIALDANQRWGVGEAIAWMRELASFEPYWIEEPTSPDDIFGHRAIREAVAPIRVATGEHMHNAVMAKQFLRHGAIDVLQIDACRVSGVSENIAMLLLAAKFNVPVCPHAGGVGLCELVQHLAIFDVIAVSGRPDNRAVEYVSHLHEHMADPVTIGGGRYRAPSAPGFSAEILPSSIEQFAFVGH